MNTLFSLEEIDLAANSATHETDAGTEVMNLDYSGNEIIEQQKDLANATCVLNTLASIEKEMDKAPDGVSAPVGRALTAALEHLCRGSISDNVKIGFPAFEEFSTFRDQKKMSLESMEKIREVGKKVWEWIKNLLERMVAAIRRTFNVQNFKRKKLVADVEKAEEEVKVVKQSTAQLQYNPTGFSDRVTMAKLATNGRFVGGHESILDYEKYHSEVSMIEKAFLRADKDVMLYLTKAVRDIYKKANSDFSKNVNLALVAITAPLSGKVIPNQRDLPTGVKTLETPLLYAGVSIYRECVVAQTELVDLVLKTEMKPTSHYHDSIIPDRVDYLNIDDVEAGLRAIRNRFGVNEKYTIALYESEDALNALNKSIGKAATETVGDDMVQRRARRLLNTISAYSSARRVFAMELVNYNDSVSKALLNYCVKSIHADIK